MLALQCTSLRTLLLTLTGHMLTCRPLYPTCLHTLDLPRPHNGRCPTLSILLLTLTSHVLTGTRATRHTTAVREAGPSCWPSSTMATACGGKACVLAVFRRLCVKAYHGGEGGGAQLLTQQHHGD